MIGKLLISILYILWKLPWLKIISISIIFLIVICIWGYSLYLRDEKKFTMQLKTSDPQLLTQSIAERFEANYLTSSRYEEYLLRIANQTGCMDAMLKLAELYSGEKDKLKKDSEKHRLWIMNAAKAGDIESIKDYYGFSDYDLSSENYNEIIHDLENARILSEDDRITVNYLKGIINYKIGQVDVAKQQFESLSSSVLYRKGQYMLFKCFVKKLNFTEAEKLLPKLEADGFKLSAEDYMCLYEFYATKKDSAEQNYSMEMNYFEKYASCEDADRETINKIGGDFYYNMAIALENGNSGLEKDMVKALEAYEKASDFGYAEASYCVGLGLWIGKYNNIRNYYKANKYMMKAAQEGSEEAQKILGQYGVDGVLIIPMNANTVSYRFGDNYELSASNTTMKWIQLYYGILYKTSVVADEFVNKYLETFKSFDDLINGIHSLYMNQMAEMLKWCILLLMSFGIDEYGANDIIDGCKDLSLLPRVPYFEAALEKIDNRALKLNIKTAYVQATRGQWSGAGFGTTIGGTINAAIKASVAAGVMNVGSGILHEVGDSIAKAIDNAEIRGMEKKVFTDPKIIKEFRHATYSACVDIGSVVRKIIEFHCDLELKALEGAIKFGDEELSDIECRTLNAKISNNLIAGDKKYVYALLVEKMRREPLNRNVFFQIIELKDQNVGTVNEDEIHKYGYDFGLWKGIEKG